mmetsp:Transcript_51580/g.122715  ORF Transcript_51580/g.122715 Transcript_51580/m.122715 type:complete len:84 (+) Transcript_51580:2252-2503(+)
MLLIHMSHEVIRVKESLPAELTIRVWWNRSANLPFADVPCITLAVVSLKILGSVASLLGQEGRATIEASATKLHPMRIPQVIF